MVAVWHDNQEQQQQQWQEEVPVQQGEGGEGSSGGMHLLLGGRGNSSRFGCVSKLTAARWNSLSKLDQILYGVKAQESTSYPRQLANNNSSSGRRQ